MYCLCLASAITVNNQSAKDIDQYFKTMHQKSVLILPNGLKNPERERTTEQKFNIYHEQDLNPQPLDINTTNSRRGHKTLDGRTDLPRA